MKKLSANQLELLNFVCEANHTFRQPANVRVGKYGWNTNVLRSLLLRNLVRYVDDHARKSMWTWGSGRYIHNTHRVELTSAGWDVFYRIGKGDPQ
jgi:hypothetical protein